MKRVAFVFVAVALLPTCVAAQEQGWAAKFFQNNLTHNFGNVPRGAVLNYKFPITNIYSVPFQVTEARVSCGCVTPKRPAQVIPARGSSELEINLDTLKINPPGPKTVSIFVTLTSVPQQPNEKVFSSTCTLTVSCVPKANLVFNPGTINFGLVQAGTTPRLSLDVEYSGDPNWQITEVVANQLPLEVQIAPLPSRIANRVGFRVTATLKKDVPAGEFKYEVLLRTSDPNTPVLNMIVEGNVQAPIVASPNAINFGTVPVGTAVVRHVIVRGTNVPFRVTAVEGEGDGITVRLPEKAAVAHVVSIALAPTKAGMVSRTLILKTDLNGGLTTTVKVDAKTE